MRIDVKKILFVGLNEERARFFEKAQELGLVQFIDVNKARSRDLPEEMQNIHAAIKIVRGLEPMAQEDPEENDVVQRILDQHTREEALLEEQRVTRLEIARVHIFGDFSLEDIRALENEGRVIQFFVAKEGTAVDDQLIHVGTDQGLDYFVSISKERQAYENLVEMQIGEPLGVLQKRLKVCERQIHETQNELKKYARYNTFLHHALIEKWNSFNLAEAEQLPATELEGSLFTVEGWIPADKVSLLKELNIYFEEIAVEEKDAIPTYLENSGLSRMGEDLVHIYDTPAHTDTDPSLWVLVFFSLFYAMIIADAGYGLIFLLGTLYFAYKTTLTETTSRFKNLAIIASCACIVWGVLINSFFGLKIAPESPLRKISMLQWLVNKKADYHYSSQDQIYNEWLVKYPQPGQINNYTDFLNLESISKKGVKTYDILNSFSDNILLELALLVGTVHICLSLMRSVRRNWAAAGWILAIIGAYLYIPYYLNVTSMTQFLFGINQETAATTGGYLFVLGVPLAVILSVIQNRWLGLLEITQIIQIFSDILSYVRLYALAVAGAIISVTINEIAGTIPLVFGVLLVVIGHIINIVLSIMGGVINGLRLNFLEWYRYSFQGGGKLFTPLKAIGSISSSDLSSCDRRNSEFCSSSIASAMNSSQTSEFLGLASKCQVDEIKPIAFKVEIE